MDELEDATSRSKRGGRRAKKKKRETRRSRRPVPGPPEDVEPYSGEPAFEETEATGPEGPQQVTDTPEPPGETPLERTTEPGPGELVESVPPGFEPAGEEEDVLGLRTVRRVASRGGKTGGGASGFTLAVIVAGAGALATLVWAITKTSLSVIDYSDFLFWLVLFTLAAHFEIQLRGGGKLNLGLAPLVGALLGLAVELPDVAFHQTAAIRVTQVVWIFVLGTIVTLVTKMIGTLRREDAFSMLMDLTGVGLFVLVFYLLVKLLPNSPELRGDYTASVLIAAGLAACFLYAVFLVKEVYLEALEAGFPPGVYLQSVARKSWLPFMMLGFTGVLMGLIFVGIGMWSVLFVLPLLAVYLYAFNKVAETDRDLLDTIMVLSAIPEITGVVNDGHAERVAKISEAVARELGLAPEEVQQVEFAAYLHDIGIVGRPGGAAPEQPQLEEGEGDYSGGVDIVGKVDYLEIAAEILGGREGLRDRVGDVGKRRAVSLGVGIIQAVDDFELLVEGRGDRGPMTENEALTEMNLERGIRYDSKVLRAIARVLPRLKMELSAGAEGSTESSPLWGEPEG